MKHRHRNKNKMKRIIRQIPLTMSDILNDLTDTTLLEKIIKEDRNSDYKKNRIPEASDYYNSENQVIMSTRQVSWNYSQGSAYEDISKPNWKLPHGYFKEIVDQASEYLVGRQFDIEYPDTINEKTQKVINDALFKNISFDEKVIEYLETAQKHIVSWLYLFVDEFGEFKTVVMKSSEIIAISNNDIEPEITLIIRYFDEMVLNDKKKEFENLTTVEVYDNNQKVTFKQLNKGDSFFKHVSTENLLEKKVIRLDKEGKEIEQTEETKKTIESTVLSGVPFIPLMLNKNEQSELDYIKLFIDLVDVVVSGLGNNIDNVQDVVWVLKNYEGQDLKEFMADLKKHRAVRVGDDGGVDTKTVEIPVEARKVLFGQLEASIYKFGRGVNFDIANIASVATETLQILFARLDLKSKRFERQLTKSIRSWFVIFKDIMNFMDNDISFDDNLMKNDIKIKYNRTMIINQSQTVEMIVKSEGLVSQETLLSHHPLVIDTKEEMARLEAEQKKEIEKNKLEPNLPPEVTPKIDDDE